MEENENQLACASEEQSLLGGVYSGAAAALKAIAGLFGFELDTTDASTKLLGVVEAAFALLTILGVVVDPTTEGVSDSERAQSYTKPWTDKDDVQ